MRDRNLTCFEPSAWLQKKAKDTTRTRPHTNDICIFLVAPRACQRIRYIYQKKANHYYICSSFGMLCPEEWRFLQKNNHPEVLTPLEALSLPNAWQPFPNKAWESLLSNLSNSAFQTRTYKDCKQVNLRKTDTAKEDSLLEDNGGDVMPDRIILLALLLCQNQLNLLSLFTQSWYVFFVLVS